MVFNILKDLNAMLSTIARTKWAGRLRLMTCTAKESETETEEDDAVDLPSSCSTSSKPTPESADPSSSMVKRSELVASPTVWNDIKEKEMCRPIFATQKFCCRRTQIWEMWVWDLRNTGLVTRDPLRTRVSGQFSQELNYVWKTTSCECCDHNVR